MKKGLFCALSILVFAGAIASYFFVGDKTAPEIKIKSTPVLDENSGYDDLINYAEANDENLKSFVIENNSLLEILENKYITYVAIDKNNNIAKATVDVEIRSEGRELEIFKSIESYIHRLAKVNNITYAGVNDIVPPKSATAVVSSSKARPMLPFSTRIKISPVNETVARARCPPIIFPFASAQLMCRCR